MSTIFDVAVIGGGIAGAAASLAAAQSGLSVVWVRPDPIQNMPKVGESLAPAANPILSELGIEQVIASSYHRKANATFSAWGQANLIERNSMIHLEGAGHIIDRLKFEQDIFQLASEASTQLVSGMLQNIEWQHMTQKEDVWCLTSDTQEQVQAKFIVDATGRSQVLGKFLARQSEEVSVVTDDHLVAAYAFVAQQPDSGVIPTPATLIESVPDGWWYASLLPSNQLTLNYYSDPDLMPRGLTSDLSAWKALIQQTHHIAYWLDDAEFVVDQPPELASAATRWLSSAAGVHQACGWAAIGDAAVSFDPLSAHGMTTALWAAARVPDLVRAFLKHDYLPLEQYAKAVEQGRQSYLHQRHTIYAQEKRFQSQAFWQRRL